MVNNMFKILLVTKPNNRVYDICNQSHLVDNAFVVVGEMFI